MASITEHTYPQIVWRNREKKLWNPIHKKALKNLPEERIRLRVIEYLMQAGWSKHRISTEESIGEIGDTSMRTDIICYNQQFEPRLLVECKAEHIPISGKTAEQVARYNQKVGAPFLLMTNGISDHWYAIGNGSQKVEKREVGPDFLDDNPNPPEYNFDYWQNRGFTGAKAIPVLRKWFKKILPICWLPDANSNIRFLNFGESPSEVELSQYYRIIPVGENRRLAITTLNTAFEGNRMVIILNESDKNKAVLEINLDLLFADKKGNTALYSENGIRTFELESYWNLPNTPDVTSIAEQANQIFLNYVD